MAIYPYAVKFNGEYYEAWESVPEDEEMAGEETSLPYSDSEIAMETEVGEKKYTKSEINHMSTAELQNLAASRGIEGAFDMTGTDLKKRLISDLNL